MNKNLILGVSFALISTFLYSSLTAVIKIDAGTLPLPMIVFMQMAVGLLVAVLFLFRQGMHSFRRVAKTQKIFLHLSRAICGLGVNYCMFFSVKYMPLVNAVLLANTTPLIVPFIAYILYSQPINHRLWVPMLVGFVGVLLVMNPDSSIFNPVSFMALGTAVCIAMAISLVKKISVTDSMETTTFYFFLLGTIMSGILSIKYWISIPLPIWGALGLIGLMYAGSQYSIMAALRYSSAQLVSCMLYTNIVFSVFISAIVWHISPSLMISIGVLLTVIGGIFCIRVEHLFQRRSVQLVDA